MINWIMTRMGYVAAEEARAYLEVAQEQAYEAGIDKAVEAMDYMLSDYQTTKVGFTADLG